MAVNTTTQQSKSKKKIEFYDYYYHLKNFGFRWEKIAVTNSPLQIIYEITLLMKKR